MEQVRVKEAAKSINRFTPSEEIKTALHDSALPKKTKSKIIYNVTSRLINDLFESEITSEKIHEAKQSVSVMLDGVIHDEITIASLIEVSSYDYYTYTHCVNVAVYSVGLGKELGLSAKELERLGSGGILHDLGKAKVDIGLINKPGKLTEEEFTKVKEHPALGYDLLRKLHEDDSVILSIVRHHHEKLNGKGYPDGLMSDGVDMYARIVAIGDIFDALTTKRSYKPALSTFEALELMRHKMHDELDPKLLSLFILMMGKK
ncbi:MAG: HD-GYP domain-containing protein [Campylobacterales bacterium]